MLCKDLKDEIFEAALSGAAPGDGAKAHLATCSACEHEFESLRSTMNVLDTWTAPEPSQYFDARAERAGAAQPVGAHAGQARYRRPFLEANGCCSIDHDYGRGR